MGLTSLTRPLGSPPPYKTTSPLRPPPLKNRKAKSVPRPNRGCLTGLAGEKPRRNNAAGIDRIPKKAFLFPQRIDVQTNKPEVPRDTQSCALAYGENQRELESCKGALAPDHPVAVALSRLLGQCGAHVPTECLAAPCACHITTWRQRPAHAHPPPPSVPSPLAMVPSTRSPSLRIQNRKVDSAVLRLAAIAEPATVSSPVMFLKGPAIVSRRGLHGGRLPARCPELLSVRCSRPRHSPLFCLCAACCV